MKGLTLCLEIAFISMLNIGCFLVEEEEAEVRFQTSIDTAIHYGIKFGESHFVGYIDFDEITDYFTTETGSFYVELYDLAGNWVPASNKKLGPIEDGGKYTLMIDIDENVIYYTLSADASTVGGDSVIYEDVVESPEGLYTSEFIKSF